MIRRGRLFCFGFSSAKGSDGRPQGHAAIKIRPRNAYELLGLRRPVHFKPWKGLTIRYHVPVMAEEVVALLRPALGLIFLDGTVGGGGHCERLLQHGAEVVAIDQDADALEMSRARLAPYAHRLRLCEANYEDAGEVLDRLGIASIGGALLDLGVSSYQLDTASRGFAMTKDGPLDMRMSRKNPRTAAEIVNTSSPAELARIFREYGKSPARCTLPPAWRPCASIVRCAQPSTCRQRSPR